MIPEASGRSGPDADDPAAVTGSDEALMRALAGGDDLALNPLMDRWQAPLRGFLYRYTQNEHDALDLAQETFVRVYQHRARFRADARFSTWMFQIALNLARSRARWQKRHPTDSLDLEPENQESRLELSDEATPAADALRAEKIAVVRNAIAVLPPDLRAAVILSEYEEKSHAEIAVIARTTPKAVETRLYRARQQLRKALEKYLQA
ncbi:MAG: sigma-70 family RNA polymerase sigma factor [Opitutaceae bacterium]